MRSEAESAAPLPRLISGLEQVHSRYHGFLVDAWGVLHDGNNLYPGVGGCLQRLRKLGKPVVIISNAARREAALQQELARVGIERGWYHSIVSSGEQAWQALHSGELQTRLGRRAFYLGPQRSISLCAGLDLEWCARLEDCSFVLNAGAPTGNPANTDEFEALLETMLALELPMLCANPDGFAVRGGRLGISAGAIARRYEEMGARQVIYFGKPQAPIFTAALARIGEIENSRVLVIGDGLDTDIEGACASGLDSLLISAGIHRGKSESWMRQRIAEIADKYNVAPLWCCELLRWQELE